MLLFKTGERIQITSHFRPARKATQSSAVSSLSPQIRLGWNMTSGLRYMVDIFFLNSSFFFFFYIWDLGDMIYFKVLGQGFLILGSMERAYDLFERRSSNYSDRPRTVMLSELFVSFL
jgi:hypothetical protein